MFNLLTNFRMFMPPFNSCHKKIVSLRERNPVLYGDEASPPVRFVLMTASALGIEMDYKEIDLFAGKNKSESYKKINPLQKVPALVIKDQVICDSHAICMYFCKQSEDNTLYPSDASTQARIDEMLFFNSGTLFPIDSAIFTDYFSGKSPVDQLKLNVLNSALDYLEFQLNKNSWLTGEEIRLCDVCLMATVTSIYQIVPNTEEHTKVHEWLRKCETLPFYEINRRGLERLMKFVKMM